MKKIITVIGARPQFVKAAIVSRAIADNAEINEVLLHTGQHYDDNMSRVFLEELELPEIKYQLSVNGATHGGQTAQMLESIEKILITEKPDGLLIYGDTNSTLAGALAAAKLHIPIAHVEAGLRSYNRIMPEEINRIVADQLSDILFAPTIQSVENLKKEGFASSSIFEVGDVMFDASLYYAGKADQTSQILERLKCQNTPFVLATIHRAENTDHAEKLINIFRGLDRVAEELPVIFPLHPRTRKCLSQVAPELLQKTRITIIDPIGFLDMVMLEKNAALIVTDSGGVQKEAFFYQVPCVTLRTETEWVETVEQGWNRLVSHFEAQWISGQVIQAIGAKGEINQFPYGKGDAALRVAGVLVKGVQ